MNLILSADNNYAPFLGIAIFSILESNRNSEKNRYEDQIVFYVMDMDISVQNKKLIDEIVNKYNAKITYLNTKIIHSILEKSVKASVRSLATYYRLYLPTLLPLTVEKAIYLDCDSFINQSLRELWNIDIEGYDIAGVLDVISIDKKLNVGLSAADPYFNAGMLVINLKQWREKNLEEKMINFINHYEGKVSYHDQGTINGVCLEKKVLHPKFNAMTPIFVLNRKRILDYHNLKDYYNDKLLQEAKDNPVFCHLTPYLTDRPWVKGNYHPLKKLYRKFQKQTPWAHVEFTQPSKTLEPWVKELFHFLPYFLFVNTLRTLQSFRPKTWLRKLTNS
ncbi:glycosyltransferase family 8 protein [Kaistella sp. 97-N-M2]|uniref:glycosyltransferase family 8 protein n=1 Tax=Kaistella sp. 97-N-M2 TaxID=2908645 RepID=UPI001F28E017|nr:glycosyltransferase family 8 protein [Kaistella sp. 97-N-M2]UJF29145.1 glycosyltransferase family 8 protein [Kaistella sp. 97-N-M2]